MHSNIFTIFYLESSNTKIIILVYLAILKETATYIACCNDLFVSITLFDARITQTYYQRCDWCRWRCGECLRLYYRTNTVLIFTLCFVPNCNPCPWIVEDAHQYNEGCVGGTYVASLQILFDRTYFKIPTTLFQTYL